MNSRETQMKTEVLSRVRSIYYMRMITRPFTVNLYLCVVAVISISFLVSIPSVVTNMMNSQGAAHYFTYLFSAFLQTSTLVQLILLATLILAGFLVRDILANLRRFPVARFFNTMAH